MAPVHGPFRRPHGLSPWRLGRHRSGPAAAGLVHAHVFPSCRWMHMDQCFA
eukprot:CAMPEP_0197925838 /NCGR_PEP_ID=MMETSP1439-20131203/98136_1 /TAXON_ID=66791 /ORGANISM="Gonyaulax spinifera, Strain CCMP409" /LENGTH=50 /DNA_ID=CAMNT_0043548341 /DNA_START=104 /DNA_END=252 /DNA_ORIENTATION=+